MRFFLSICFYILVHVTLRAQQGDNLSMSEKYQSAYHYVSSPKNLKRIGKVFRKMREDAYPPNVLPEIYPVSIMMLDKSIIEKELKPDTGNLARMTTGEFIIFYNKENYFEPAGFVQTSFPANKKSQVYIVFSKPKEDYLLAEVHIDYYNKKPLSYQSFSQTGSFYKLLFTFDDEGKVKKLYCKEVHQ
jgi:hypothetical protein